VVGEHEVGVVARPAVLGEAVANEGEEEGLALLFVFGCWLVEWWILGVSQLYRFSY
jgi:hypothetical protein